MGKPLSGAMLINMHYRCIEECTRVRAAIAYAASDNMSFSMIVWSKACRWSSSVGTTATCPIDPKILQWFLDRKTPSITCRWCRARLHAKVIWWKVKASTYLGHGPI